VRRELDISPSVLEVGEGAEGGPTGVVGEPYHYQESFIRLP